MHDDDTPKPKSQFLLGEQLDSYSVEDLTETIAMLKAEIERLETAVSEKTRHLNAAESLFSKK